MPRKVGHNPVHPPAAPGANHAAHFNQAMADALENIGWDPDTYDNVSVTFQVKLKVTNPGQVDEYRVILSTA